MQERDHRPVSRRVALKGALGASAAAFIGAPMIAKAAQSIVVSDPGGPYGKAFAEAFYKPFAKESGIEVQGLARSANPSSQIKAFVETGQYQWDVTLLTKDIYELVQSQNLVEPLDLTGPDAAEIPSHMKASGWLGITVYAAVNCYRTDVFGTNGPKTFADVWNREKFPGRRSLRKFPRETIEMALRADGVPGGPEIYKVLSAPGGWERAYKKLDEIKPHISVWWSQGSQASQLLKSGDVAICPTFNARAQDAIEGGAPVRIEWEGGFYGVEGFSILKGNGKTDACRQFVKFCARADRQAAFTQWLAYGPANPASYKHIDKKRAELLPTQPDNLKQMAQIDENFWAKNKDTAVERFEKWLLT